MLNASLVVWWVERKFSKSIELLQFHWSFDWLAASLQVDIVVTDGLWEFFLELIILLFKISEFLTLTYHHLLKFMSLSLCFFCFLHPFLYIFLSFFELILPYLNSPILLSDGLIQSPDLKLFLLDFLKQLSLLILYF